jgi:hypothetical protein
LSTKLLLIEAFLYLGWARLLKMIPFSLAVHYLGIKMEETTEVDLGKDLKMLKHISNSVNLMSKYTFWESQCLVKAIAAMKMLQRRNIESTLYLGTAKDEKGRLMAHAWLRSGSYYLTGSEGMKKFTVISSFAQK